VPQSALFLKGAINSSYSTIRDISPERLGLVIAPSQRGKPPPHIRTRTQSHHRRRAQQDRPPPGTLRSTPTSQTAEQPKHPPSPGWASTPHRRHPGEQTSRARQRPSANLNGRRRVLPTSAPYSKQCGRAPPAAPAPPRDSTTRA